MLTSGFLSFLAVLAATSQAAPSVVAPVKTTTCNGKDFVYNELAGYGFVPSNARDKFGDTMGGWGSAIAMKSWKRKDDHYEGTLYALPDRGWNTGGTVNTTPRIHKFSIKFTPRPNATVANPSNPNLEFTYKDTILLVGPDGVPTTGLDPDQAGYYSFPGFPDMPAVTYPGDGFGGSGPGGKRICIDGEGLVLAEDGNFWVSDEYGPYVYKFNRDGKMIAAIRPVDAILPLRKGVVSFSADSPPRYDLNKHANPSNPTQGRQNNQGFEGLTMSPDGKNLYVLLQSAGRQEGGASNPTRRYTRLLQYAVSGGPHDHSEDKRGENEDDHPDVVYDKEQGMGDKSYDGGDSEHQPSATYVAEYVVPLPTFTNAAGTLRVAAQSDIHFISPTQFFFLPRDSSVGHGQTDPCSVYRHIDIFDISSATNAKGAAHDNFNTSIASSAGVLNTGITPAAFCSFIDFNINPQLNRFKVHNCGAQDAGLLNEKWESIALATVDGNEDGHDENDEYFLFSVSDNDFITQNGFINGGKIPFADASGYNLDNQALVFKIKLPKQSNPLLS